MNAAGETPLHLAAEAGHNTVIKLLLQAGAAVNIGDSLGRTSLHRHLAARRRRKEIVVLLLNAGADASATDNEGRTVLDEATERNAHDPLAEVLREAGAKD
jgi:ankyrin repeat protein